MRTYCIRLRWCLAIKGIVIIIFFIVIIISITEIPIPFYWNGALTDVDLFGKTAQPNSNGMRIRGKYYIQSYP